MKMENCNIFIILFSEMYSIISVTVKTLNSYGSRQMMSEQQKKRQGRKTNEE